MTTLPVRSDRAQRAVIAALAVAVAALLVAITALEAPLRGPGSPLGGVHYQFAWTHDGVRALLDGWGPAGKAAARRALHVDIALLCLYPWLLSLLCARAAARPGAHRPAAGGALARIVLLALPADAIENAGLLRMLGDASRDLASDVVAFGTGLCATTKFALILVALAYLGTESWHRRRAAA